MSEERKWINYIKEYASDKLDVERNHIEADKALCLFLRSLGYTKLVEEYEKVERWYA